MSLAILAAAIAVVTFAYIALRWRKSPKVFKAMNIVTAADIVAGVFTGIWLVGLTREWLPDHSGTGGSASGGVNGNGSGASGRKSTATTPDLNGQVGVFVDASDGRMELPCYGSDSAAEAVMQEKVHFHFGRTDCIPRVSNLRAFLINLPGANVTDSQIFWFHGISELEEASWSALGPSPRDPQPLKDTIQVSGSVFRIESPEFETTRQGFISLVVKMPLGIPDRMDAVEIGG